MGTIKNITRLLNTGKTLGGLGARIGAQEFLGLDINEEKYAVQLRQAFGNMKGPFMKIAQFLATVPNALPQEFANEFLQLQAHAPPMGAGFVKRRMKGELGSEWQSYFKEFDEKASFAASLGQVHRAVLKTGETVAVKLQYPEMQATIDADLLQLDLVIKLYKSFNKSLDPAEVANEIKERLYEELDYTLEAENIDKFSKIYENTKNVKIPKVFKQFSTPKLLVLEWMEGKHIFEYKEKPQQERNMLGELLFRSWYYPVYNYGMLHGDPHPGNYLVDDNQNLIILDFGCVRCFPTSFLQAVADLYRAFRDNDQDLAVDAYKRWGFNNPTKEVIETLNLWAGLLYEPLLDDSVRYIQDINDGDKGYRTARAVHKKLHELGGVKPPREFVFMDRAAVGIGSAIMHLKSQCNWHQLFEEMIAKYLP